MFGGAMRQAGIIAAGSLRWSTMSSGSPKTMPTPSFWPRVWRGSARVKLVYDSVPTNISSSTSPARG